MKDFYGVEIKELVFKDGNIAKRGDVIRWNVYDSDDNITWTFTGLYQSNAIVYLGGGSDFGNAIGKSINVEEAITQSQCNDDDMVGIEKVAEAYDLARCISDNLPKVAL